MKELNKKKKKKNNNKNTGTVPHGRDFYPWVVLFVLIDLIQVSTQYELHTAHQYAWMVVRSSLCE